MIRVEQTILGGDTTVPAGQRGNCLAACIASVFELSLDEVPNFVAFDDWWGELTRFVEGRGFILGTAFMRTADDDPTRLTGYPSDPIVWIASVFSPRLVREDGTPGLHMIVMRGGEVAWDPHPQRELGHLGFNLGYVFTAIDPGRLKLEGRRL